MLTNQNMLDESQRASEVVDSLQKAVDALAVARKALDEAADLLEWETDDFTRVHEVAYVKDMRGAVNVAQRAVINHRIEWASIAQHRRPSR